MSDFLDEFLESDNQSDFRLPSPLLEELGQTFIENNQQGSLVSLADDTEVNKNPSLIWDQ